MYHQILVIFYLKTFNLFLMANLNSFALFNFGITDDFYVDSLLWAHYQVLTSKNVCIRGVNLVIPQFVN